jgi:hypothetical protein
MNLQLVRIARVASATLLAAAAPSTVLADVVMVSETKVGEVKSRSTMSISGSMVRADNGTETSVIMDTGAGVMTTLVHEQKMAIKVDLAQLKAMAGAPKAGAVTVPLTTITATGQTRKINGYNCELYLSENSGTKVSMWITRDYPGYAKLKAELATMEKLNTSGVKQPEVPGFALQTEYTANGLNFVTSVVSLKEEKVDAGVFKIPADYKTPGE